MKWIRTLLLIVGAMVVGAALWDAVGFREAPGLAPPVERASAPASEAPRLFDAGMLLRWGREEAPIAVVDTARDALPNGLALAMVSLLVDWEASQLAGDDPHAIVRNVYVGGNPVLGDNVLATVRVPFRGITDAQWCLVLDRNASGRDTAMGHALLRFTYALQARPEVLGLGDRAPAVAPRLDDLILSWEAWRPPLTRYDPVAGLDPESYAMTVRAYSGAQRFLTDALRRSPWKCYPLALPDTSDARAMLLGIGLAWGDSLLRRVLATIGEEGQFDEAQLAAELATASAAERRRLAAVFAADGVPEDPITAVLGQADLSYQLLERSCVTQSLTAIQWAVDRLYEEHALGTPPALEIVPDGLPPWARNLSIERRGELLGKLPGALVFVATNRQVLPGNAWQILEKAGLLQRDAAGRPLFYYYFVDDATPYGALRQNMM